MRRETEVQEFTAAMYDEYGEEDPVAEYKIACFEGCIPKTFWDVVSSHVSHNEQVFNKVVIPYRKRWKRALKNGYSLLFVGDNGSGKLVPLVSKIFTPNGVKEIGDLKVGDYVIGSNGKSTRVLKLHPIVRVPTYQINFSDGRSAISSSDHLWSFDVLRNSHGGNPVIERKTKTLGEWMKEDLKTKRGWRRLWLPMLSGPVIFDKQKKSKIDPYTLGVILGDGYISGTSPEIIIGNRDLDIVDNLVLPKNVSVNKRNTILSGCVNFGLSSTQGRSKNVLKDHLKKFGLWGLKSKEKFIPKEYFTASQKDRLSLLQGLFDTDGSPSRRTVNYSTMSERLAYGVRDIVESLGGIASINRVDRDGEYSVIVKLPVGIFPFRTKYKLEKFQNHEYRTERGYDPKRSIVSIVETGKEEWCRCITVDAIDGLYAIEGCVLTHNTMFISYLLTQMIKRGLTTYYTTLTQLDIDIKMGFRDNDLALRLEYMLESDFVAIDEIGKEAFKTDGYLTTRLEHYLKKRYDDAEPVLLSSNIDIESLCKMYGSTIESMFDGKYRTVSLEPGDFRKSTKAKMKRSMGYK